MSEHLSGTELNSLADAELSAEQMARVNAHLAGCAACTTSALSQMMLKRATALAGQRHSLPDEVRARMLRKAAPQTAGVLAVKANRGSWVGWGAAAAMLLLLASLGWMQRGAAVSAEEAALVTEVSDQHVAMMAANAPPEVVSSDRHTVKPWFQGKLPFSFNLPTALVNDTTLDGANLTYLRRKPVAQLLYSIGKHRVSVFVFEKDDAGKPVAAEQAGFHVMTVNSSELEIVGVSDVEVGRLRELVRVIGEAQTKSK